MRGWLVVVLLTALMLATGASFFAQAPGAGGEQQAQPEIKVTFEAASFEPEGDPLTTPDLIRVMILNMGEASAVDVRLELWHTPLVTFAPLDRHSVQNAEGWLIETPGRATKSLGDVPSPQGRGTLLRFTGPADGCVTTTPMLIVRHSTGAIYAESTVSYSAGGTCSPAMLPAAGAGAGDSTLTSRSVVAVAMLLAAGAALIVAGVRRGRWRFSQRPA